MILHCPLMFSANDVLIGKLAKSNRLQIFLLELKCLLCSSSLPIVQRIHALLQQGLKSVGFRTRFLKRNGRVRTDRVEMATRQSRIAVDKTLSATLNTEIKTGYTTERMQTLGSRGFNKSVAFRRC